MRNISIGTWIFIGSEYEFNFVYDTRRIKSEGRLGEYVGPGNYLILPWKTCIPYEENKYDDVLEIIHKTKALNELCNAMISICNLIKEA